MFCTLHCCRELPCIPMSSSIIKCWQLVAFVIAVAVDSMIYEKLFEWKSMLALPINHFQFSCSNDYKCNIFSFLVYPSLFGNGQNSNNVDTLSKNVKYYSSLLHMTHLKWKKRRKKKQNKYIYLLNVFAHRNEFVPICHDSFHPTNIGITKSPHINGVFKRKATNNRAHIWFHMLCD